VDVKEIIQQMQQWQEREGPTLGPTLTIQQLRARKEDCSRLLTFPRFMATKRTKKKLKEFILDCSVTMAWYFKDEANDYANVVRRSLAKVGAVVPGLWPLEVAKILVLGERRHRSTHAEARKWLGYLQMLPIRIDEEMTTRAWSDTLYVARSHNLSAYDAPVSRIGHSVCPKNE
jgi:predicted nucleic acid-binding protein